MPKTDITACQPLDFPVVGVGACAGDIVALQALFKAIPARPNLAFVLVQHLPPGEPSRLASLLSQWTALPVHEAAGGVKLQRDCLYVAPPDRLLGLERGLFVARPFDKGRARAGTNTIDALFESLALELGPRAIGVVLSGTGADGAAGAVRIKQAGGLIFVQDPVTVLHEGISQAVIACGAADRILPLETIAEELVACASPAHVRPAPDIKLKLPRRLESSRYATAVPACAHRVTPKPSGPPSVLVDDARSSGEAVRSSHQELAASREELQVLNEELKTTNEQLNLANARLYDKIAELEMQSRVLSSGAVITLFLDEGLRVRWFTPAIDELFPLRVDDAGRCITDLAQKFEDERFIHDVRAVMQTGKPLETEVRNEAGRWFLRRIRPYLATTEVTTGVAITFTDITERKAVEAALRQSEAQLQLLLESTTDGVEIIDKNWRYVYRNPAGRRMQIEQGLAPDSGIGQVVWEAYPTHVGSPVEAAMRRAMEQRAATSIDFAFPPTGREFHTRFFPMSNAGISVFFQDVTERKAMERALRASRAELAAQLERAEQLQKISTGLIPEQRTTELYGQLVEAAALLLHADAASMQEFIPDNNALKLLAWRGFHPASAAYWQWVDTASRSCCGRALKGKAREIIADVEACPDMAGTRHLEEFRRSGLRAVQSTPLKSRDGELLGMISTLWREPHTPSAHELQLFDVLARQAADLIARTRAEAALRANEERQKRLLETDAVGVLFFEKETGILLDANDAFLKMTGYSRQEVESRSLTWQTMTPPEWIAVSEDQLEVLKATGRIGPYEKEYFLKDGSRAWMLFAGRDLGDGTVAEFAMDISRLKQAEAVLRESEKKYRTLFETKVGV